MIELAGCSYRVTISQICIATVSTRFYVSLSNIGYVNYACFRKSSHICTNISYICISLLGLSIGNQ